NGHSRCHCKARRSFQTATPCTISPKAMIRLAVCTGVRTCSQTAAATRPKAKPASPATSAAAKVASRKNARSKVRTPMAMPRQVRRRRLTPPCGRWIGRWIAAAIQRRSRAGRPSSALRARGLVEGGAQALAGLPPIVIGPEVHEDQPRLLVEHVAVDRGHLDAVFPQR